MRNSINKDTLSWYWEHFKLESYSIQFETDPYPLLHKFIDTKEKVWFIVNETINERIKFWFYEGTVKAIQEIIPNISRDEYYLVSKKYNWLLCLNHHFNLIGTDDDLPGKIKNYELANLSESG